jgi:hypothetical protein
MFTRQDENNGNPVQRNSLLLKQIVEQKQFVLCGKSYVGLDCHYFDLALKFWILPHNALVCFALFSQ